MDIDPTMFWNLVLSLFVGAGGWFIKSVIADLRRIEVMVRDCERDIYNKFVPKTYHDETVGRIEKKLDKLTDSIESARMHPLCGWTPEGGPPRKCNT